MQYTEWDHCCLCRFSCKGIFHIQSVTMTPSFANADCHYKSNSHFILKSSGKKFSAIMDHCQICCAKFTVMSRRVCNLPWMLYFFFILFIVFWFFLFFPSSLSWHIWVLHGTGGKTSHVSLITRRFLYWQSFALWDHESFHSCNDMKCQENLDKITKNVTWSKTIIVYNCICLIIEGFRVSVLPYLLYTAQ